MERAVRPTDGDAMSGPPMGCYCGECDKRVEFADVDFTTTPGQIQLRPCGHVATMVFKARSGPWGVVK